MPNSLWLFDSAATAHPEQAEHVEGWRRVPPKNGGIRVNIVIGI